MSGDWSSDVCSSDLFPSHDRRAEIGAFETMKQTEGWQLLEKKIREELQARIHKLVKDDVNIQTLLALLQVTDTKTRITTLEGEIEKMLPDS